MKLTKGMSICEELHHKKEWMCPFCPIERDGKIKGCQCTLCNSYRLRNSFTFAEVIQIVKDFKNGCPVLGCIDRIIEKIRMDAYIKEKDTEINIKDVPTETLKEFWRRWGCSEKSNKETTYNVFAGNLVRKKEVKEKAPLHPGTVAIWLLGDEGYVKDDIQKWACKDGQEFCTKVSVSYVAEKINANIYVFSEFVCGDRSVDCSLAYKLIKILPNTTMEFWMDLQERYDEYMRKNK